MLDRRRDSRSPPPARADGLLARGARWSDDPLGECRTVVVSLYDGAAVRGVMGPRLEAAGPGVVVVDTSTVEIGRAHV